MATHRHRRLTGDELDAEWQDRIPDGFTVPQPGYERWGDLLTKEYSTVNDPQPELVRPYIRRLWHRWSR